jgi:hypothetical protein
MLSKENSVQDLPNLLKVKLEKNTSFNFLKTNPPTVEFRTPGQDYLNSFFQHSHDAIDWLVYITAIASIKDLFRREYLNKIAKIANSNFEDDSEDDFEDDSEDDSEDDYND